MRVSLPDLRRQLTRIVRHNRLCAVLLAAAILAIPLGFYSISLLCSIGIMVARMPIGGIGYISRIALLGATAVSANALLGVLLWLCKLPYTILLLCVLYAFSAVTIFLITSLYNIRTRPDRAFQTSEIVAGLLAVVTVGLLLFPLTASRDNPTLVRYVGTGVDNIAHLNFIRQIEQKQGYISGTASPIQAQIGQGATAYPQGYHLNAAFFNDALSPIEGIRSTRASLILYILFSAISYGMVVYLFAYLGFTTIKRWWATKQLGWTASAVIVLATFTLLGNVLLSMYIDGFAPQIGSIALFLAFCILISLAETSKNKVEQTTLLIMAAVTVGGNALFYLYSWPVLCAAFVIALYILHKQKRLLLSRTALYSCAAIIAASFSQLAIHLAYSQSSISKLNDQGGTLLLDGAILAGLFLVAVAYVGFTRVRIARLGPGLYVLLIASVCFSLAVLIFQKITIGGPPGYYFYKSTYTLALLLGVILTLPILRLLAVIAGRNRLVAVAGVALICLGAGSPVLRLYTERRPYTFNQPMAAATARLAEDPGVRAGTTKVVSFGNDCLNSGDLRLMRMLMTLTGRADPLEEKIAERSFPLSNNLDIYDLLARYYTSNPRDRFIVVTADPAIQRKVIATLGTDSVRYALLDPYQLEKIKPVTGCPF